MKKSFKEKVDLWKLTNNQRTIALRLAHGSKRQRKTNQRKEFFNGGKNVKEDRSDNSLLQAGQPGGTPAVREIGIDGVDKET